MAYVLNVNTCIIRCLYSSYTGGLTKAYENENISDKHAVRKECKVANLKIKMTYQHEPPSISFRSNKRTSKNALEYVDNLSPLQYKSRSNKRYTQIEL